MAGSLPPPSPHEPLRIAELLARHPWPAELAKEPKLERLWTFELPGKPESLWPFMADTSRMNRALGLSEMKFEERDGKRFGSQRAGGVLQSWLEVPWNWVAHQWFTGLRLYERGFARAVYAVYVLEAAEPGTRLQIYFGAVERNTLGGAALRLGLSSIERAYRKLLPAMATQLDQPRPQILLAPPPVLPPEADARLRARRDQLLAEGLHAPSVDALVEWIRTGEDVELYRIQIRERARVWKLPEDELLKVALHATRAGLLTLSWDTVCPHCRGVRDENDTLAELAASSRCEACKVDFTTDAPEAVEVTFHVHPSIRDVPQELFCSAEPAKKDHIRVQVELQPGARTWITPRLDAGRYRVRLGTEPGWYLDVSDHGALELEWEERKPGTAVEGSLECAVELHNPGTEPQLAAIERATWVDHALRAGRLLAFQDFRDLFSSEYIGAGVRLGIGEQTVLFTDVVGSTAFYVARGDPSAFMDIKKHFDEVFAIVAANQGAVVKTIGDAVMAVFTNPVNALRACKAIHDAFGPARADLPIRLRISLNTGPCIAVRLNANADFFGGTINVAAKLQSLAESYQVALSERTYRAPGVAEYLAEQGASLEEVQYVSKALPEPVLARRWTVHRG